MHQSCEYRPRLPMACPGHWCEPPGFVTLNSGWILTLRGGRPLSAVVGLAIRCVAGWYSPEVEVREPVAAAFQADDFGVLDEPADRGGDGGVSECRCLHRPRRCLQHPRLTTLARPGLLERSSPCWGSVPPVLRRSDQRILVAGAAGEAEEVKGFAVPILLVL